jgi:hypothetical protein
MREPTSAVIVRRSARLAILALLAAVLMYVWGAWHLFVWNIEELCTVIHHEPYDPQHSGVSFVPLARKCNQAYDLVPGYVNPTVVTMLILAAALVGVAVVGSHLNRKAS